MPTREQQAVVHPPGGLPPAPVGHEKTLEELKTENRRLRKVLQMNPKLYDEFYMIDCVTALKKTTLFGSVPEELLWEVAKKAERKTFPRGHFLAKVNTEVDCAYIITEGDVQRWAIIDSRKQQVSTFCDGSVGTLHLWSDITQSRFNAECLTEVVAYSIRRADLEELMVKHPKLATSIIRSLASHIRQGQKKFVTPLLEQKGFKTSVTATTIAACFDAFFRSGMNSLINRKLSGHAAPPLPDQSLLTIYRAYFPNMHVQVPVRAVYINGLKQIRRGTDTIDCSTSFSPGLMRVLLSFVPGVVMCPFSSILEAANVPNNPTPLYRRWTIGFAPRLCREVIFGVGMNQLADWCSSKMQSFNIEHPFIKYAVGSISAGWIAGYFSTVPHSLSTLRLMNPDKSYKELWHTLIQRSAHHVPDIIPRDSRLYEVALRTMAVAFPVGMARRSAQIAGTFLIVNGFTYVNRNRDWY